MSLFQIILQCNRKKAIDFQTMHTWNIFIREKKKKISLPPISCILLVSQKDLVLMFHLEALNETETSNKFFSHPSNHSWVKEISQHWLDSPASIISKYRSSNTALQTTNPTMNKYIIYTQVWTGIWRSVSLCEQKILKAFEEQGIISVESITQKRNFFNLRCLIT